MRTRATLASEMKSAVKVLVLTASAIVMTAAALDAARGAAEPPAQTAGREVIPSADQLTAEERETYRRRMADAVTPEEQASIRAEYAKLADRDKPAPKLVGDPARGAQVHSACFSCHGIERYTRPVTYAMASFMDSVLRASGLSDLPPAEPKHFKGQINSLGALRAAVARRNDYLNPKMTPQEFEDVIAYLNQTYYKFPQ
jgi:mono/diheme cytochrome c family protein